MRRELPDRAFYKDFSIWELMPIIYKREDLLFGYFEDKTL